MDKPEVLDLMQTCISQQETDSCVDCPHFALCQCLLYMTADRIVSGEYATEERRGKAVKRRDRDGRVYVEINNEYD